MRRIRLTQGRYATVDDRHHDTLIAIGSWYFDGRYAATTSPRPRKQKRYMHRVVAELEGFKLPETVDHRRSQRTLNNQISNLRPATRSENQHNRKRQNNNSSGYRGVTWHRTKRRWMAQIVVRGRHMNLGGFRSLTAAARAYDGAVRQHRKLAFRKTNFSK